MTHTPTLPNGFSRDFSEAPAEFLVYFAEESWAEGLTIGKAIAWRNDDGEIEAEFGLVTTSVVHPLCWCPIPTPGDAVLKELAEGK